jgi:hypothetical protein
MTLPERTAIALLLLSAVAAVIRRTRRLLNGKRR